MQRVMRVCYRGFIHGGEGTAPGQLGSLIQRPLVPPASCVWARSGVNAGRGLAGVNLHSLVSHQEMGKAPILLSEQMFGSNFFQLVLFGPEPGDSQMNAFLDTMLFSLALSSFVSFFLHFP